MVSPALLARIRAEFSETPGLKLTIPQACRRWDLQDHVCREALDLLAVERFLFHAPSGAFVGVPSAIKMLKAENVSRPSRCPHCQHLNSVQIERTLIGPHSATTFRCVACGKIAAADLSA